MSVESLVWREGRLIDTAYTETLCVHNVGLTPGLWCGGCNTHPEHPGLIKHELNTDTDLITPGGNRVCTCGAVLHPGEIIENHSKNGTP